MGTLKNLISFAGISLLTTTPLAYLGGYVATGVANPIELRRILEQRATERQEYREYRKSYDQAAECLEQKFGPGFQIMLSKLTTTDLKKVVERCETSDKRR